MEVLAKPATILTNAEVLTAINQVQNSVKRTSKLSSHFKLQSSEWIANEVKKFLRSTDCAKQTPENVTHFLDRLNAVIHKPFTRTELVQFVNLRPTSLVEVHTMVDDCDGRFTEEEIMQLLDIISTCLPQKPKKLK